MRIAEIHKTCIACPSAWEGKLGDGREIYVKYRYGHLRIDIDGETYYEKQLMDGLDGFMNQSELFPLMLEQGFVINDDSQIGDENDCTDF